MYRFIAWLQRLWQATSITKGITRGSSSGNLLSKNKFVGMRALSTPMSPDKRIIKATANDTLVSFTGTDAELPGFIQVNHYAWVVSQSGIRNQTAFDEKLIDYLTTLASTELAGSNMIPRVPSVMIQLLKRMHEENVSSAELVSLITKDVVLVAAILKEVNSAYYKLPSKMSDLSQAILLLGHNRLRMVMAKVSFTPIYNQQFGALTKDSATKIWDTSQKRALACYLIAKHQQVDPFLAFLAGLMLDVGFMVALRVVDQTYKDGYLPSTIEFRRALEQKALLLSTRISAIWSMPEMVIKSLEGQGVDKTTLQKIPLARVLKKADYLCKISILMNAGVVGIDVERLRATLSEAEADCLFTLLKSDSSVALLI